MQTDFKTLRKSKGLKQIDLATKCNCSQAAISAIEIGIRTPGKLLARKIAKALEVPIETIWEMFY